MERVLFEGRLVLYLTKFLYVYSLHHFLAVGDRGLFKGLAATELFYDASLLKFSFKLL